VVGALAMFGLSLLLAGALRSSRRGHEARRGLMQSRRETAAVTQDRDDLIDQRETARAYNAATPRNGVAAGDRLAARDNGARRGRWHLSSGFRSSSSQADAPAEDTADRQSVPDVPAGDVNSDASATAD
jgi:hypothetical protein